MSKFVSKNEVKFYEYVLKKMRQENNSIEKDLPKTSINW